MTMGETNSRHNPNPWGNHRTHFLPPNHRLSLANPKNIPISWSLFNIFPSPRPVPRSPPFSTSLYPRRYVLIPTTALPLPMSLTDNSILHRKLPVFFCTLFWQPPWYISKVMRCGYRLRLDVNTTKLDHGCYLEELHLRSAGNPLRAAIPLKGSARYRWFISFRTRGATYMSDFADLTPLSLLQIPIQSTHDRSLDCPSSKTKLLCVRWYTKSQRRSSAM